MAENQSIAFPLKDYNVRQILEKIFNDSFMLASEYRPIKIPDDPDYIHNSMIADSPNKTSFK